MDKTLNLSEIHKNHRKRLKERFMKNPQSLSKHELVELLLFYSIPRRNTNPLAHLLIDKFGSISNILRTDPKDLMTVNGVGENTAAFLYLIGKLSETLDEESADDLVIYNYDNVKTYLVSFYAKADVEIFCAFFLAKDGRVLRRETYSSGNADKVSFLCSELAREVAIIKPDSVVITHNHPSGNPLPSRDDDVSTERIYYMLSFAGVKLYDHVIVAKDKTYSYRSDGRLAKIEDKFKNFI